MSSIAVAAEPDEPPLLQPRGFHVRGDDRILRSRIGRVSRELDGVAHQQGHQKVVMVRGHGVLRYQRYEGRTGQVDPQRHVVGPNLRLVENAAESKSDDTGRNLVDAQDEASSRRVAFQRFHRRVVPPAASSRR